MTDKRYMVAPIYNEHNIRIIKVRINKELDHDVFGVTAEGDLSHTFHVSGEHLFETIEEAKKQLEKNVLEFIGELRYSLEKQLNGD